jgi:hypothetical protein
MKNVHEITTFSLSAEELALALSMINKPDLGRQILNTVAPQMSDEQIDARLTSASHSLVARGLADISLRGNSELDSMLEKAIFPMAKYDQLLQISSSNDDNQQMRVVYSYQNNFFAAHWVEKGVVNIIDYGSYASFADYVSSFFSEIGKKGSDKSVAADHKITLGTLGKAMIERSQKKQVNEMLFESGLSEELAGQLTSDILKQKMRGSLMLFDINSETTPDTAHNAAKETILMLRGPQRSWLFEFANTHDEEVAHIQLVNRKTFEKVLRQTILH